MEYFFSAWEAVKRQIEGKTTMLFLDFDGTLAPIAARPALARLPQETGQALQELVRLPGCKVAVVSGRALNDLARKVDIEDIVCVGNHGLEIEGPGIRHTVSPGEGYAKTLQAVKAGLPAVIESYPGAFVEDKGLTLSVHFRQVALEDIIGLQEKMRTLLSAYSRKDQLRVRTGKMVIEIRPPVPWDKGKAALWLVERWRLQSGNGSGVMLYCGDDATDEDAFRALQGQGITVAVGAHEHSAAQYYLSRQEEVLSLLKSVLELKRGTG